MSEALDTISPPSSDGLSLGNCTRCGGPVDVRTRHLIIDGPAVLTFCSQVCATRRGEAVTPPPPPLRPRYSPLRHLLHLAVGVPMLVFTSGYVPPKLQSTASTAAAASAIVTPPEEPAFGPTWTLLGLVLGNLLGGIAVVETVFTIPGLGRLLVDSIFARDYPVIQGCLLFIAVIYVLVNLVVDLCYPLFDPRVTAE